MRRNPWLAVLVLAIVAVSCGGSSNKATSSSTTATTAPRVTTTTIDVASVCANARNEAVAVDDAMEELVGNEYDEVNHYADEYNALRDAKNAEAAAQEAGLKEHTDAAPKLAARVTTAQQVATQDTSRCRDLLAGKKLADACEAVFTQAEHKRSHLVEARRIAEQTIQTAQRAVAARKANDLGTANALVSQTNALLDQSNRNDEQAAEASRQLDAMVQTCLTGGVATTTTAPPASTTPSAELQQLAASFGCTDLKQVAAKRDAIETGTCTFRGLPFVVSRYPSGSGEEQQARALDYCLASGMATTAQTATALVADGSEEGTLEVTDVADKIGGELVVAMC